MVGRGRIVGRTAVLLALVLTASLTYLVAAPATPASAATGGLRDYTLRYTNNANGQITMASNVVMQCPTDTVDPSMNSACAGSRAGTNARNNNSYDMRWLDIDSDPWTFDSSSAQLLLPASGRVLFAGLYWTGVQKKGTVVTGSNGFVGVPVPAPSEAAIGSVKLKVPGSSAYAAINSPQIDTGPIANNSGYTAFADVTALVTNAGAGTYTVADVQTGTGGNMGAGWSLVVAYADQNEPLRNLSIFDGMKVVANGNSVTVNLSGFKTPSAGTVRTTIGVVAAEGDAGATGDYLTVNDNLLTDAIHPANNTENSTIANRGTQVTTKSPDWRNQLGYDASFFQADGFLGNNDTAATFSAKTTNDTYAPQAITFATELFSPDVNLTKTATIVGGGPALPGATIHYSITATNNGLQNATNVELADLIPAGTTLTGRPSVTAGTGSVICAPVSACSASSESVIGLLGTSSTASSGGILAPSASVTVEFDAVIAGDAVINSVIENVAELHFVSPDLGLPISKYASADVTVAYPDPGVVKTLRSVAGNRYTFDVLVRNYGTVSTTGSIEVTDTLGAAGTLVSIGGTGWNCISLTCSRSDALAADTNHPMITVVADYAAGQPVLNTATLTGNNKGGQPTDPNSRALVNDQGTSNGGTSPTSTLIVHKSNLTPVVSVGEQSMFVVETYNSGPTTAVGATMHDVVPAGLEILGVSTTAGTCSTSGNTVDCQFGDIQVGYAAFAHISVAPDASIAGTTVTNTATATSSTTITPGSDSADLEIRPATDLALTKVADVIDVNPGDTVTYTLTGTNLGSQDAADMQIVDHLPDAMDMSTVVVSPSGAAQCDVVDRLVNCNWPGSITPGTTMTVTITITTNSIVPVADRQAMNYAEISTTTDDLDPSNDAAQALVRILPYADVQATAAGPGVIGPDGDVTLTFTNTNNGPSIASDATIDISIDPALTIVSASPECTVTGQSVSCAVGDLLAGTAFAVDVVVHAPNAAAGTTYLADVHAESDAIDPIDPILGNNDDVAPLAIAVAPVIDTLGPTTGPSDGGTEVVIDGTSFTPESNVDIGGTACTDVTFVSAQQLTCISGPHDPGTVDVVVTNPDGQSFTLPGAFTYVGPEPEPVVPSFTG